MLLTRAFFTATFVAIHHHMTDVKPTVIFLHYYGTGPVAKLAEGVRAAVDVLGRAPATRL